MLKIPDSRDYWFTQFVVLRSRSLIPCKLMAADLKKEGQFSSTACRILSARGSNQTPKERTYCLAIALSLAFLPTMSLQRKRSLLILVNVSENGDLLILFLQVWRDFRPDWERMRILRTLSCYAPFSVKSETYWIYFSNLTLIHWIGDPSFVGSIISLDYQFLIPNDLIITLLNLNGILFCIRSLLPDVTSNIYCCTIGVPSISPLDYDMKSVGMIARSWDLDSGVFCA